MITVGCRFEMLRQAFAKRVINCLRDLVFPWTSCWRDAKEVAMGLLSTNRTINQAHRV